MAEYGYSGKILRIDLSSGKFSSIPTSDYSSRFLGGKGKNTTPEKTRIVDRGLKSN